MKFTAEKFLPPEVFGPVSVVVVDDEQTFAFVFVVLSLDSHLIRRRRNAGSNGVGERT